MKKYIILLVIVIAVKAIFCLGAFNMMNLRNHPEYKWKELETEHCKIIYHDPLYKTAEESAQISENTYETLNRMFQVNPNKKIIIYISDQDNIPNGASLMSHYIFIWVNQNDYLKMFTGHDKWLKKVIAHEMTHWFVFYTINDWMAPFIPINSVLFPRDVNEGYAQFFSGEEWGYNRGDRYLRTSIITNLKKDNSSRYEGGLTYAQGFAFVRYLVSEYGEESIIKLLKYRNKARMYHFKQAIKEVYHKDFSDIWDEYERYISTYYYGEIYNRKSKFKDQTRDQNLNDIKLLTSSYRDYSKIVFQNDYVLFSAKHCQEQSFKSLIMGQYLPDSLQKGKFILGNKVIIDHSGEFSVISFSSNQQWVSYTKSSRHQNGRIAPRIFRYSVQSKEIKSFGEGNYCAIDNQGGIYYQKLQKDQNVIFYQNPAGVSHPVVNFDIDDQMAEIKLSANEKYILISQFDKMKHFKIIVFNTINFKIEKEILTTQIPQNMLWVSDDEFIYSVENELDFILEHHLFSIRNNTEKLIVTLPMNCYPALLYNSDMIALTEYYRGGYSLSKVPVKVDIESKSHPEKNYYTNWLTITPSVLIPDSLVNKKVINKRDYSPIKNIKWRNGFIFPTESSIFGSIVLSEALGKHLLMTVAYLPYSKDIKPSWFILYENKCFTPLIQLINSNSNWISGFDRENIYYQQYQSTFATISYPVNIHKNFQSANAGTSLGYHFRNNPNKENPLYHSDNYFNTDLFIHYNHQMPWLNSEVHSVRKFDVKMSAGNVIPDGKIENCYQQYATDVTVSFAPMLFNAKKEFIRTVSLETRNHFEQITSNNALQKMPGTDSYQNIEIAGKPMFKRFFLRGYEETLLGKTFFNTQNELRFKLTDNLKFNAGWNSFNTNIDYTGIALWYDFSLIDKTVNLELMENHHKNKTAYGFELKMNAKIFGINTLHRMGTAYHKNFEKLNDYYILEIPVFKAF